MPSQRESDTCPTLSEERHGKGQCTIFVAFSFDERTTEEGIYVFCCLAAVSMKADGFQVPAGVKKALAPAVAALSIAAPAFAEGTGEVIYFPRCQPALFLYGDVAVLSL